MVAGQHPEPEPPYEVEVHRAVRRFLNRHPELKGKWDAIVAQVLDSPKLGSHVDHLEGEWHCSYRWNEGTYRIKYQVRDDHGEIYFYDANTRGDVYKRGGGARRLR